MNIIKPALLLSLICAVLFLVSGGRAQDSSVGDLGQRASDEDLDSSWLDTNAWLFYGYRPHVKANMTRFTSLPSYFAGKNYYAYGETLLPPNETYAGGTQKDKFQMTKYGAWH